MDCDIQFCKFYISTVDDLSTKAFQNPREVNESHL